MINTKKPMSKKAFLILRKTCCLVSLVGAAAVAALMLLGFVTFGGRILTAFSALNLFFFVLDLGVRPFISVAVNVSFAIFYYTACIKTLVSIFAQFKRLPLWFKSNMDSEPTRDAALKCVKTFDSAVLLLCIEMIVARALIGDRISMRSILVVGILAVVACLVGGVYFYLTNRDLVESAFIPLCRWLLVAGALIAAFLVCDTNIVALWNALGKFIFLLSFEGLESAFILDALVNTVAFPIFQLVAVLIAARLAYFVVQKQEMRADLAKSFLKYSIVALVIVVVANGLLCSSRDPMEYFEMFFNDILFVLVPLFALFVSQNLYTVSKSAPYMEDKPASESPATSTVSATPAPAVPVVSATPVPVETVVPVAEEPVAAEAAMEEANSLVAEAEAAIEATALAKEAEATTIEESVPEETAEAITVSAPAEEEKSAPPMAAAPAEKTAGTVETAVLVEDLKKFKELLDSGIITQEEFDAKKKQLLGL